MLNRAIFFLGAAAIVATGTVAAACGSSSSAKTSSSPAPSGGSTAAATRADNGTPGARGGPGNRTPRPAIQTSIAEGTPAPGGFGNRTPAPEIQTAIAEGTPASALRGPGGGRQTVAELATLLAMDQAQLQTELQAPGATIASVAAAYGKDRATVRQALIDAQQQRATDAVNNGSITQAMADDQVSQFEARVDQVLDGNGSGPPAAPPPAP